MDGKAPIETLRGPDTALAPIFSDRVASAEEMALGGSGSNSPGGRHPARVGVRPGRDLGVHEQPR
jgi:hypothetical protein